MPGMTSTHVRRWMSDEEKREYDELMKIHAGRTCVNVEKLDSEEWAWRRPGLPHKAVPGLAMGRETWVE